MKEIREALNYFEKLGMPIDKGLIDTKRLTLDQIESLKKWEEKTEKNGIIMPEIEDFYKTVLLAISTYPQKKEDGQINYLFGKGIGVEIALRGQIPGRHKHYTDPIYRSHSDMELYDTKNNEYPNIFQEIFGSQEIFPETKTKGLDNIPKGYMDNTHEIVILDEYEILIPQLEILFLDKFLRKEKTPREGVYDCELLAREYDLDIDLIREYMEKYYFEYYEKGKNDIVRKYIETFSNTLIRNVKQELYENESIESSIEELNNQISEFSKIRSNVSVRGIRADMYVNLEESDIVIDEKGNITLSNDYIERTIEKIDTVTIQQKEKNRREKFEELEELFQKTKTTSKEEYKEVAYSETGIENIEKIFRNIKNVLENVLGGNQTENDR